MPQFRQLAAIMFTDIVGYTALMGDDEQRAFGLLNKNREIHQPIIELYEGKLIKELGDGILASFPTVSDALFAAIKIQKACSASKELSLRIGIHEGEVISENNDIYGDAVNIASRIQTLGIPGSILFSKKVADEIKNKAEFHTVSLGSFEFKNVKEPIEVFALANDGFPVPKRSMMEGKLKKKNFRKRNIIVAVSFILLAVAAFINYKKYFEKNNNAGIDKSIAVLPFVDMSAGKDQEYFSDGLSEELLNRLTKIPELKVIGRTSSFSFKGKNEDLRIVGEKLGVAHILEGSVQKEGNQIRVTAQLIRTADGFNLWSDKYDRNLEGIFKLQDEIANAVVKQLRLKLLIPIDTKASSSTNTEVYNLLLQGNYFVGKRDKENLAKALDYYLKALAIDSLNARSWAAVGKCYVLQSNWGWIDRKEGLQKAMIAANKSIALDNTEAEGHYVSGQVKMWDFDWVGAEAEYQKVLDLEPGHADALRITGFLYRCTGHFNEAIRLTKQSLSLDPVQAHAYFNFGQLLYHANELEEAIGAYKKLLELNPQFPRAHIFLGKVYLLQRKPHMALAEMRQEAGDEAWRSFGLILAYQALDSKKEADQLLSDYLVRFQKNNMYQLAEIYAFRGEKNKAFEFLEKSYTAREARLTYLKGDPLLKNLESDPRYKAFLKKMNLPVE
jgi:TolB-like protein/class 3 adenylate cyclase/Flp pilus assembly protein TadD